VICCDARSFDHAHNQRHIYDSQSRYSAMLYQLHEFQRSMLHPLTAWAQATAKTFTNPLSPLSLVPGATRLAAGYELLYRLGKEYEKPEFDIKSVRSNGRDIPIVEQTIIEK